MNNLKITLNEDGSVLQYTPDFKIMRGSYRNVLINIEVPHSLLIDPVNDTDEHKTKTGNNVRVGGIINTAIGKHLQTKRYECKRVKDFVREGTAYRLYQRKMPKEFTMWNTLDEREEAQSGSLLLVINVINWLKNDLNAKVEEISASPSFRLDIQPSAFLQNAEEIEDLTDFDLLQSQVQDHDKEIDELQKDLYGEGDKTLGEFLTSRLKAGWKIILKKDNGQIKIAVDVIKGKEIPIDTVSDLPAQNVQKAIEEIWKRVDFEFVDSLTGEDDYLVDNTDPHNPVIKHDKTKIDKASIADNLATSDNTKVLAASQGIVIKGEIENLQNETTNLETVKASKTEVAAAIKAAIDAVVNSAPEAFDTLKEISDWIKDDEEGTSALILRIGEIEKKNEEQDQALVDEINARESVERVIKESISAESTVREEADETLKNSKLDDIQVESGTLNGTIKIIKKINEKKVETDNISVSGLGSAAFTDKAEYATAEQGIMAEKAVSFEIQQNLTEEQKTQARANIGAGSSAFSGSYRDLGQKPALDTTSTEALSTSADETIQDTMKLHKIAKTGTLADAITDSDHETISATQKAQINTNKSNIESNDTDIADLQNRMNTAEDDIAMAKSDIEQAETDIDTIESKIPNQASASNQLADKNFVNSSINNVAAYYITKNAEGDPFATKAELTGATIFYSGGVERTPTRNDYCTVLSDESQPKDELGNYPTARYTYQGQWEFAYAINNTTFTSNQLAALNSGITSTGVSQIATNKDGIKKNADAISETQQDLNTRDEKNVKLDGDQTIEGRKIFNGTPYYKDYNNPLLYGEWRTTMLTDGSAAYCFRIGQFKVQIFQVTGKTNSDSTYEYPFGKYLTPPFVFRTLLMSGTAELAAGRGWNVSSRTSSDVTIHCANTNQALTSFLLVIGIVAD